MKKFCVLLSVFALAFETRAQFTAFNDHRPGPQTSANATTNDMLATGNGGPLKDFTTGAELTASFFVTVVGATPDDFGGNNYPNAGTPAYNLFNGIVDVGNNGIPGIRNSAGTSLTITFTNLNPGSRYKFRGTSVRGNSYVDRWSVYTIEGADAFVDAHVDGSANNNLITLSEFPTATLTNGQVALNSGENREGSLIGWDDVIPGADGAFSVRAQQYMGATPFGTTANASTVYGYGFTAIYLEEVLGTITPIAITNQPQSLTVTVPRPATFSVGASGSPRSYFWRKNGLVISGATGPTYTIPVTAIPDSGTYSVIVSNSMGAVTSSNAVLTVRADTNGPTLISAVGNSAGDLVTLMFSEPLDPGTGAENSNYEVLLTAGGGDLLVSSAAITNGSNVVVTLDPSTPRNPGENYSVRISNVTDLYGNSIVPNPITRQIRPEVILVGSGGSGVLTFSTTPPAGEWATLDVTPGDANTYTTPDALDAGAQTLDQATITTALPITTANGTARLTRHNTTAGYLVTQPTGVPMAVLMARLRNDAGAGITSFTVRYDYSIPVAPVTDECPGQRVFYSLSGAPDSWTLIPEFSGITTAGPLSATLSPGMWPNNTDLYLLFLDDNNVTGADGAFAIDNFAVTNVVLFNLTAITITNQPQSLTVTVAQPATFSVGARGAPLSYFWRKNGTVIAGATGPTYTIPSTALTDAGVYSVIVSNSLGAVTSANATLTVNPDTSVLTVVSVSGSLNLTNFTVTFSDRVGVSGSNAANFQVALTNGSGALTVVSAVVNNGTNVVLTTATPRTANQEYSITVTGVSNQGGNVVSPNPTVRSIGSDVILVAFDAAWKYFLGSTNAGGDLTGSGWEAPGYNDSAWLSGPAGLGLDSSSNGVPIRTPIAYMTNGVPVYFRTHFTLSSASGVTLLLRDVVEDGAIYYLNGREALRRNVGATNVVTFATLATAGATDPTPIQGPFTLPTTNLVAGDNVLAVLVLQNSATSTDIEMAAELSQHLPPGGGTTPTAPRINIAYNANNTVTLTWNGAGYRLQEAAALGSSGSTTWSNSTRVSGTPFSPVSNRFYRLISP